MPSWNDGETSCEGLLSNRESRVNPDVPETLHDPDFCGIARELAVECDHGDKLARYVAFDGQNTGRKFLGCARRGGEECSKIVWLDSEWPDAMKKCLVRLWEMYENESSGRLHDMCEQSESYYKLNFEKQELEQKNKNLQIELGQALSSQGSSSSSQDKIPVSQNILDLHKFMREKAEKQRDERLAEKKRYELLKEMAERKNNDLKEEKKKLEYYIADLLKALQEKKDKMKKIKVVVDE